MRKIYLSLLAMLILSGLFAQEFTYTDSWGAPGLEVKSQNAQKVTLNFSIEKFTISATLINGESMQELSLPDVFLPNAEGAPNLPAIGRFVAIPQGATVNMNVVDVRIESIQGVDLAPAPRIPWDTETGPLEYNKDPDLYTKDAYYPEFPVQTKAMAPVRGIDAVMLGITPFQYNPVTKELLVYRDIEVEITFNGGSGQFGEDRLRSRWWDPVVRNLFVNQESIPHKEYNTSFQGTKNTGCEYLIVTPNDPVFQAWADSIRIFRTRQGIMTDVMTVDDCGGNAVGTLESFFNEAYNTWDIPPAAVLLLGDYSTNGEEGIVSPIWNNYCASDNIYADVTGNDMPDIIFARMTAQNEAQLEVMISKFLDYERTPPTDEGFYNHPITALGWQTERWFQICSESIGGFWKNEMGKEPVRINEVYGGNPEVDPWSTAQNTFTVMNVFGPNGLGYIPASPSELGNWSGGDADDINDAINNGSFLLQHRDHGFELGWGEPDYSNSDINGLTNTDLCFIMSINCLTGKYNHSSEVFTEKFHRYAYNGENSGALGLIAASEVSYSFVNDAYVWGVYDNLWPEFLPQFGTNVDHMGLLPAYGNAAGKYFLMQSQWPYNQDSKEVTYNLFHHHGDAFLRLYSEVPEELIVLHNEYLLEGALTFHVTTEEGALIALTVDDEIIGTAVSEGGETEIDIPYQAEGGQMLLTVTKQNYFRYASTIEVIDSDVPYVVLESYSLNDLLGNGNALLDYGESITLSVGMENIGNIQADNVQVTLSTENEFITITDGVEVFGDFAAAAAIFVDDAFAFEVDYLIPDNQHIFFNLEATDGSETWTSQAVFKSHAPVLEFTGFIIHDEAGNNNGRIDPGETVEVEVSVTNTGSSAAMDVVGELLCAEGGISIDPQSQAYGELMQGQSLSKTFEVTVDATIEEGLNAVFEVALASEGGITGNGSFNAVVGQLIALVLDLDPMHYSGPGILETFGDMDVYAEYATTFPDDLGLYKNIFVCLGLHFTNYELSEEEGQLLKDYMLNGGNVYMEGRVTWKNDPQTPVHAMFNVEVLPLSMYLISDVVGAPGSMTWNMTYGYDGNNPVCDYALSPIAPAYNLFSTQDEDHKAMVAYNAGTYHAIASTVEFGMLADGEYPSTKQHLMEMFLEWFEGTITGMDEYERHTGSLSSSPNPFSDEITLTIDLQAASGVELSIRDLEGREVRSISKGAFEAGAHAFKWDGTSNNNEQVAPGIYFGVLKTESDIFTEKIILLNQ